jgi:hypothetical protein
VRARLVKRAADWKWSGVHAHLTGVNDGLTTTGPLHARVDDFAAFLDQRREDEEFTALRKSEIVGRPIGDDPFIDGTEADPSHAHVWQAWALLERDEGNVAKARELFQKGTEADPSIG